MKVWTCTDHDYFWPVGVASVIVAETEEEARELLNAELLKRGLKTTPYTLEELDLNKPSAQILQDGNY